jgi:hypothetical protein
MTGLTAARNSTASHCSSAVPASDDDVRIVLGPVIREAPGGLSDVASSRVGR